MNYLITDLQLKRLETVHILLAREIRSSGKVGDGELVSNCCASDFDVFGREKEDGIFQERCLNCGKLCEPIYLGKLDIENIKRCLEWNK